METIESLLDLALYMLWVITEYLCDWRKAWVSKGRDTEAPVEPRLF